MAANATGIEELDPLPGFSLDVDADNYAETAAGETPSKASRTYQSEEDFQLHKAEYTARVDSGDRLRTLEMAVACLREDPPATAERIDTDRTCLSTRDVQLLGYAAGELYFEGRFAELQGLCTRVLNRCTYDSKLSKAIKRWEARCAAKLRQ